MLILRSGFGRLANRLFISAHTDHLAAHYNTRVLDLDSPYSLHFRGTRLAGTLPGCKMRAAVRRLVERRLIPKLDSIALYDDENKMLQATRLITSLQQGRNIALTLETWLPPDMQQEYSVAISDKLRHRFTPIQPLAERAARMVAQARERCDVLIGVHIRHTDFMEFDGGRHFLPVEASIKAMQHIRWEFARRIGGEIGFLLCSDACHELAAFNDLNVTLGPGDAVADMTALAGCDYIVNPPRSTFARWSSWWGQVPLLTLPGLAEAQETDFAPERFRVAPLQIPA